MPNPAITNSYEETSEFSQPTSATGNLLDFSEDVFLAIADYLPLKDYLKLREVCRPVCNLINEMPMQKTRLKLRMGGMGLRVRITPNPTTGEKQLRWGDFFHAVPLKALKNKEEYIQKILDRHAPLSTRPPRRIMNPRVAVIASVFLACIVFNSGLLGLLIHLFITADNTTAKTSAGILLGLVSCFIMVPLVLLLCGLREIIAARNPDYAAQRLVYRQRQALRQRIESDLEAGLDEIQMELIGSRYIEDERLPEIQVALREDSYTEDERASDEVSVNRP